MFHSSLFVLVCFIHICFFVSTIHSELSSVFFYPVNENAEQLKHIPEITESDAISLYAHTLRSSKRSFLKSTSANKLLNTFVTPLHEGHHVMVWVPEMHSGDVEFKMTMSVSHSKPLQELYNVIGNERMKEYSTEVDRIQNVSVKELPSFDFKTLPANGSPLFKLIHVNDVTINSEDYADKVKSIHKWIREAQEQHPYLTFTLLVKDTFLRRRDLESNCYTSAEQCNAVTNTCHGRGTCVAFDNCYRCRCTKKYGGETCLDEDWSVELFLFGGVTFVWIVFFGISLIVLSTASNPSPIGMASTIRAD